MPSSKDRRAVEVPLHVYDQLAQIAQTEDRTISSVLYQLLFTALSTYQPAWVPSKHLSRLNEHARQVLVLAREEALSFNHAFIGTEHVLLGLLREPRGVAEQALTGLGVELEATRAFVEGRIGRGKEPVTEPIDYVQRVRKVLSLALDEAERRGCVLVRTEHLLLGLVREGGGVAAEALDQVGVLGRVRKEVQALLGQDA